MTDSKPCPAPVEITNNFTAAQHELTGEQHEARLAAKLATLSKPTKLLILGFNHVAPFSQ